MKYKIPILLTALVVIPLLLLALLGARLQANERLVAQHQQYQLANAQLRSYGELLDAYIASLEQDSLRALGNLNFIDELASSQTGAIRTLIDHDPMLEQVFVLNADGQRLFPPNNAMSLKELQFVEKIQELWAIPDIFRVTPVEEQPIKVVRKRSTRDFSFSRITRDNSMVTGKVEVVVKSPENFGWISWDSGNTTQLYFWFRDVQENVIGQQFSSAFWLSEMINRLPDSSSATKELGVARIKLLDKRQNIIYQWGEFDAQSVDALDAVSQQMLAHPLDGWRLEYFAASSADSNSTKTLLFGLVFLILAILLGLLGVYMFREYRREERLAQQRVTFVNQVSHELKTPLTNICMYTEMLETEVADNDLPDQQRIKKYSGVVTSESQRLARLINNVLRFSASQKRAPRIRPKPMQMDMVIQSTLDNFALAFSVKNIRIELALDNQVWVNCDEEVLEQVLNNLFSNIEKYASVGRYAHIRSSFQGGTSRIEVSDAGPGIEVKQVDKLFEPFERGSDKLTDGVSGTGIGLSIARELCRLHGGDLVYQTISQGACFIVTMTTPLTDTNGDDA